jgi:hypothetical protein
MPSRKGVSSLGNNTLPAQSTSERKSSRIGSKVSTPVTRSRATKPKEAVTSESDDEETESEEETEPVAGKRPTRGRGKPASTPASKSRATKPKKRIAKKSFEKLHGRPTKIDDSQQYKNWVARANRIGSKTEVYNGTTNHRGTALKTVGKLTSDDLMAVNRGFDPVANRERTKIVYKSRHLVGKMIHRQMHEKINGVADLKKRIAEVKKYFEDRNKSYEDSAIYKKYDDLDLDTKKINAFNERQKKLREQWVQVNEKQRDWFKSKERKAMSNIKKPREQGHFATSGNKLRKCLVTLGTTPECAKEACSKSKSATKKQKKESCAEPGYPPQYVMDKRLRYLENVENDEVFKDGDDEE